MTESHRFGHTGRNFAAGMSGGIAYVFDEKGYLRSVATRVWWNLALLARWMKQMGQGNDSTTSAIYSK